MAWDLKTAVYQHAFLVRAQEEIPMGIFFKPDGTKMYVCGNESDEVNEYRITEPWDVSTAAHVRMLSITTESKYPRSIGFKTDGTKMYILNSDGDEVNEYDVSTAWNISTATYLQNYTITEDSAVEGMVFKSDGTKMYICGTVGDKVYEYNLGTAWDITSSVYSQQFSVAAQDTGPSDLFFKDDGTKMYVVGEIGNDINQYDLVTPWDITTASFIQNFSVTGYEVSPETVFFKPDGTKMYVLGCSGDDVLEYFLPTRRIRPVKSA